MKYTITGILLLLILAVPVLSCTGSSIEKQLKAGDIFREQKQWDSALSEYNKVIEANPSSAIAYHRRGTVFLEKRQLELALADFTRALELKPDYAEAYTDRAKAAWTDWLEHSRLDAAQTV